MRAALEYIRDVLQTEINMANYDDDDVRRINDESIDASRKAEQALTLPAPPVVTADQHEKLINDFGTACEIIALVKRAVSDLPPHIEDCIDSFVEERELKFPEVVPAEEAKRLEAEVEKWKSHFISMGAVAAQKYGAERFGENCLHYLHYDMLKEAGARMDDFHRCGTNDDGPPEGLGKTP